MAGTVVSWVLGGVVTLIGVANFVWVHPVPGVVCLLLAAVIIPPTSAFLRSKLGFGIPLVVRVALGLFVVWFTLGVSDLGDMIDDLGRRR